MPFEQLPLWRVVTALIGFAAIAPACSAALIPTSSQIEGPYYRIGSPARTTIRQTSDSANLLTIIGRVLDKNGTPIGNAWLDFWHADAAGNYDLTSSAYLYRGHQFTDAEGNYTLQTILPGEYSSRPVRHIHVKVDTVANPTNAMLTTQLYFGAANGVGGLPAELFVTPATDASGNLTATFDFVLNTIVPEPGSHLLLMFGFGWLACQRRVHLGFRTPMAIHRC
jgi:protocatechuate 3,4-dioxygenase beta subunit